MNKTDYIENMNEVLLDLLKFKEIPKHEDIYKININMEDRINYQLRKLKMKMSIARYMSVARHHLSCMVNQKLTKKILHSDLF